MPENKSTKSSNAGFKKLCCESISARLLLISATVLAFLGGGYWLLKEAANTLSHISPSRSLPRSSSMEPYELSFRLATESGAVNEWKLAVPRAFVVDESGQNGAVAPWTGANTGYFAARIVLLQADNGQFVPESFVANRDQYAKEKRILISLGNTDTERWIANNDICAPQHILGDIARQYGAKDRNSPCLDRDNACYIAGTHADGWAVGIAATKDLYSNPRQVCATVKAFLNSNTMKRDPIVPRS